MGAVNIPIGSALACKVFGAGVFAGVQSAPGFMNLLSGKMPQQSDAEAKLKGQTDGGYPIVKVTDLSKEAGDTISADLFNIFTGKPVMGDRRLSGRGMTTTSSSMDVSINRSRGMADNGGKMTQKRTRHNLRGIISAGLTNWAGRLEDQRCLVHLAGARGTQATADWVIPVAADPDFNDIMVNTVKAPTKNRRFYANDATAPTDLGTNDLLSLKDFDRIGALLKESNVPLQPVIYENDDYAWNSPLWVCFVTERQWAYLKRPSQTQYSAAAQNAVKRFQGQKHPLFNGDSIMWNGILIKPLGRYAIRFKAGDSVIVDTGGADGGTYTESTVTAAVDTDRAIIVGAQALIKAYGNEATSMYHYAWNEELTDHKAALEVSLSMMEGTAKTRFKINGIDTDHGVAVIDSYAPDLGTSAGLTAYNS